MHRVLDKSDTRDQLVVVLAATSRSADSILKRLRAGSIDPLELASELDSLAILDEKRSALARQVRLEASDSRRRDEERSIRQFVLGALDQIGVPQTAGFLEDYVYTREKIVLDTRGFGALRRDENRAWRRQPGRRRAYIVPCLDTAGYAIPRWMARSDWPLPSRIAVDGAERHWAWVRVLVLTGWLREVGDAQLAELSAPLVRKYALDAADHEPAWIGTEDWLEAAHLEAHTTADRLTIELAPKRAAAAEALEGLDAEQQLWGLSTAASRRSSSEEGGGDN